MNSPLENLRSKVRISDTLQRLLIINIVIFLFIRITNAISGLFLSPVLDFYEVADILAIPANVSALLAV